jgi:uncharacterized membrane protein YgdD (TMEM256/DUF423 family)
MTQSSRNQEGLFGLAVGAFAAHGLEGRVPAEEIGWLETAARLEMLHGIALLALARLPYGTGLERLTCSAARWGLFWGAALFACSLYLRVVLGWTAIGALTPFGGTLMLVGWFALLLYGIARWLGRP